MSEAKRTRQEIAAELEELRANLTQDVDELSRRLNPKTQFENAKKAAAGASEKVVGYSRAVAQDARGGDPRAIGILAGVGVAALGLVVLLASRRRRR